MGFPQGAYGRIPPLPKAEGTQEGSYGIGISEERGRTSPCCLGVGIRLFYPSCTEPKYLLVASLPARKQMEACFFKLPAKGGRCVLLKCLSEAKFTSFPPNCWPWRGALGGASQPWPPALLRSVQEALSSTSRHHHSQSKRARSRSAPWRRVPGGAGEPGGEMDNLKSSSRRGFCC